MKWWAEWLADSPRGHARCPGLTPSLSGYQMSLNSYESFPLYHGERNAEAWFELRQRYHSPPASIASAPETGTENSGWRYAFSRRALSRVFSGFRSSSRGSSPAPSTRSCSPSPSDSIRPSRPQSRRRLVRRITLRRPDQEDVTVRISGPGAATVQVNFESNDGTVTYCSDCGSDD